MVDDRTVSLVVDVVTGVPYSEAEVDVFVPVSVILIEAARRSKYICAYRKACSGDSPDKSRGGIDGAVLPVEMSVGIDHERDARVL
jgi:hypothetical protein